VAIDTKYLVLPTLTSLQWKREKSIFPDWAPDGAFLSSVWQPKKWHTTPNDIYWATWAFFQK